MKVFKESKDAEIYGYAKRHQAETNFFVIALRDQISQDEIGELTVEFNTMTKKIFEFEQSTLGQLLAERTKSLAIVKS
ncbi:MAG: HAMP domain-containing protein, partial [Bdellovibrionota bacterium]